jgi:hypothetical protein
VKNNVNYCNTSLFFLDWETSQTKLVEKIKTRFMFNKLLPKIVPFVRSCEKLRTVEQATDDNIIGHVLFLNLSLI